MSELGDADANGPNWGGFILPGGTEDVELPVAPGEALTFPLSRPPGSGTARAGSVPTRWGPIARFVEYTDHDPHVPLTLTTGWEVPFTPHGVPELSKDMAERLQLELYVHDWWEGLGSPPLLMVSKGEKPDFRVRTPNGEMGLDATRLTSEDRRRAHNLHGYIRAAIRNAPEDFRHLHGWLVTVWFAANQIPGAELPPARSDARTRDLVLQHLASLDPNFLTGHTQPVAGIPGGGTNLLRLGEWQPGTDFYRACGMELALAYSTEHREPEVWSEVARLARDHDYRGVDRLLISVGVPAAPYGESFPSDYLMWSVIPEGSPWPNPPALDHIQTIDVHDWWLGSVTRVYPYHRVIVLARRSGPVIPIRQRADQGEPLGFQIAPIRGNRQATPPTS